MSGFNMDDYVPVAERVEAFYAKHPDGSLQSEIVELTPDRVTVKALAYRSVEDARPGIGHSSLEIPGKTTFTRGSEIENAETSAWGRAIAALGFEVKRGLSSREEVRNKQPERSRGPAQAASTPSASAPAPRSPEEQALIGQLLEIPGMTIARMTLLADAVGVPKGGKATADQLREMLDRATTPASGVPSAAGREGGGEADRSGSASPSSNETARSEGSPDSSGSDGPTPEAGDSPPVASPPAAPTDAEILAATGEGAEIVPPRPLTDAYKALSAPEKAAARAYWQRVDSEPQQETLAEALGAPTSD